MKNDFQKLQSTNKRLTVHARAEILHYERGDGQLGLYIVYVEGEVPCIVDQPARCPLQQLEAEDATIENLRLP